jgi:chloramphenicol 3-O-phosphotransferase
MLKGSWLKTLLQAVKKVITLEIAAKAFKISTTNGGQEKLSVGSFLRKGIDAYWDSKKDQEELKGYGNWSRKLVQEAESLQCMRTPRGLIHQLAIF